MKRILRAIAIMIVGLLLSSPVRAGTMPRATGATPFVVTGEGETVIELEKDDYLRTLSVEGKIYVENIDQVEEGELIISVRNSKNELIALERIYQAITIELMESDIYTAQLDFWSNGKLERVATIETFYIKEVK